MKIKWAFILLLVIGISCKKDPKVAKEITDISIELKVERFDKDFANATPNTVENLESRYPYFFSQRYNLEYWKNRVQDTIQKEIEQEVHKTFSSIDKVNHDLELLFKHIKFYFPDYKVPKTVMVASDVDYKNKVILADSLLFVSLSNYLGADHYFYDEIVKYHSKNLRKEQITVDIAHAFAKAQTPQPRSKEFLEYMIYEGKLLFLMQRLLPLVPEYEIMGYSEEEWTFTLENQVQIWEYFISNKLLYDTDRKLLSRFINPAPFSKFYLDIDNDTPGRIGRFIGFKIVESYMNKNDITISNLLVQDANSIFNNAKYKP